MACSPGGRSCTRRRISTPFPGAVMVAEPTTFPLLSISWIVLVSAACASSAAEKSAMVNRTFIMKFYARKGKWRLRHTPPQNFANHLYLPIQFHRWRKHERSSCTGRHQKRRIHSYCGRQARQMGGQRPLLRRLGDLPHEGFAGGPEPHLRLSDQRMVRADHSALERWRQELGSSGRRAGERP